MALRMPPALPGGGVFWVNNATDIPAMPLLISVHRIAPRKNKPTAVASPERPRATALVTLRIKRRFIHLPPSYRRERAPIESQQHEAGGSDDHEGDQEQQRAERYQ